jgi:hypothetical protein
VRREPVRLHAGPAHGPDPAGREPDERPAALAGLPRARRRARAARAPRLPADVDRPGGSRGRTRCCATCTTATGWRTSRRSTASWRACTPTRGGPSASSTTSSSGSTTSPTGTSCSPTRRSTSRTSACRC